MSFQTYFVQWNTEDNILKNLYSENQWGPVLFWSPLTFIDEGRVLKDKELNRHTRAGLYGISACKHRSVIQF